MPITEAGYRLVEFLTQPRGAAQLGGWADRHAALREAAEERARGLLLSLLDAEQRLIFASHGWFQVRGSAGGDYVVQHTGNVSGNVRLMTTSEPKHWAVALCAHLPLTRYSCHDRGFDTCEDARRTFGTPRCMGHLGYLPYHDMLVTQLLKIQTDEAGWLQVAVPLSVRCQATALQHYERVLGHRYDIRRYILGRGGSACGICRGRPDPSAWCHFGA